MEWLRRRPIAHRGLHSPGVPENSLSAFENAVSAGYPAELDVRLTADGVPVVFHDRVVGDGSAVSDTSWRTLRETEETVFRLETVLASVDGEVPLLVELKNDGWPGDLEATVTSCLDAYGGPFAVQSFNPLTVLWFRRHRPDWPRGQLAGLESGRGLVSRTALNRLLSNSVTRPDFVSYNHDLLPNGPVARSRKRGRPVLAWTVDSEPTLRAARHHADNVIFESVRP